MAVGSLTGGNFSLNLLLEQKGILYIISISFFLRFLDFN